MLRAMLGLDDWIASLAHGRGLLVIAAVAVALGIRHATDPDHLAAVGALVAGETRQRTKRAARLGLCWGGGHAVSLFALGLPIVLYRAYLPATVQQGAEVTVGVVISVLAATLLVRRRHRRRVVRSGRRATAIGLLHGAAGSAGVGILLLAAIGSGWVAVGGLALFAACTAGSMTALSTGLGAVLASPRVQALMPALAAVTLLFGAWYAASAAVS